MMEINQRLQSLLEYRYFQEVILIIVIALLFLVFSLQSPYFLTASNILSALRVASALLLIASGQTFIILSASIDLSQASLVSFVSVTTALAFVSFGLPVGVIVGLLCGVVYGLIIGFLVARIKMPSVVATIGMLFAVEGLTLIITQGRPVANLPSSIIDPFFVLGGGLIFGIPVPVILSILIVALLSLVLKRTRFGRAVYSIGGLETAAYYSGINVWKTKLFVWMLDGLLVAIGALILTSRVKSGQPLLGGGLLMESIAAVVIGGTSIFGGEGGVLNTFLGVLLITFLTNGLDILGMGTFFKQLVIGIVIIAAVALGLLRKGG